MSVKIFDQLIGKTFNNVINNEGQELIFKGDKSYLFYHEQECCESVEIVDICGDLSDLENTPILQAEEVSSENKFDTDECKSSTWTFYKFATIKGFVTVRWLGESNGYYSESVDFCKLENELLNKF